MPRIFFDYADGFDMKSARYDHYGCFYNSYKRTTHVSAGVKSSASRVGTVQSSHASSYSAFPVLHFADGDVALLRGIQEPEHRGRYTFGGYDFSSISTSNDPYGQHAIQFMRYVEDIPGVQLPKLNQAAFNTKTNNETQGQDLLIDHVNDRVYRIGVPYDKAVTSLDGATPDEKSMGLPDKVSHHSTLAYATAPDNGFKVQRPIRLTQPRTKLLPPEYKDIVTTCVAWFAHQSESYEKIVKDEFDAKMQMSKYSKYNHNFEIIDPDHAVNVGFAGLNKYERACIAKNNTTKKLPRKAQQFYRLAFDSAAFFESF